MSLDASIRNCDDWGECSSTFVQSTTANPGTICCTASDTCQAANISAFIVSNDDPQSVAIRCDGYESCYNINNIILSHTNGAGNIYLTGVKAAQSQISDQTVIQTTTMFDIFCSGMYSCRYQIIQEANNLYCTGLNSCGQTLIFNVNNIFGYGKNGATFAVITDVVNVYCTGYQSCSISNISNVINNVYGSGYQVLYQTIIQNVANNVIGLGYESLYSSEISNAINVKYSALFLLF